MSVKHGIFSIGAWCLTDSLQDKDPLGQRYATRSICTGPPLHTVISIDSLTLSTLSPGADTCNIDSTAMLAGANSSGGGVASVPRLTSQMGKAKEKRWGRGSHRPRLRWPLGWKRVLDVAGKKKKRVSLALTAFLATTHC